MLMAMRSWKMGKGAEQRICAGCDRSMDGILVTGLLLIASG